MRQAAVRLLVLAMFVGALLNACTSQQTDGAVLPAGAAPVGPEVLATEALATVADVQPNDELYQLPVTDRQAVLIRVRADEPPLLFGTSCDVVTSTPLPQGWEGECLEYTWQGRRIAGRFPHGTTSTEGLAAGDDFATPGEPALAAAQRTYPVMSSGVVDSMVLLHADAESIGLRVLVDDGDFCQWYGVSGSVRDGRLAYTAQPALPCQ